MIFSLFWAKYSVFLPESANTKNVPMLYWLSGLTCNEDNFMQKAGAQKYANVNQIAIICPDTSPRTTSELSVEGEHDSYDFGSGAGFYVNATQSPWNEYYKMYDYVTGELPILLSASNLPLQTSNASIFGHSMGGHGAIVSFLRNPNLYKSVSAFAPICNPMQCRWGNKCFSGYLGDDLNEWKQYDSTELVKKFDERQIDILVDQGADDSFLRDGEDEHNQFLPDNLVAAAKGNEFVNVNMRMQDGYDHSYYFISSFAAEHIEYHAQYLYN